ncbi:MAG: hypothetical protein EOO50_04935 [Flavobacterium sp.]|uniref:SBBP repeat-containing protein n=1 Tax=Flavobacterium sp. TaxID=239 RepID=UPI00121FDDFC|nr:SBBP repeat-containing protein [Flavobacterium sp.]RZJ67628.1 MAG: hypothetical protein EOO50_04935 [Flavobacterium sp.]
MGKLYALYLLFAFTAFSTLEAQTVQWAKRVGGPHEDKIRSVATDGDGNLVVLGSFATTADLNPGDDVNPFSTLYPENYLGDIFISKLDENGDALWITQIGCNAGIFPSDLSVDAQGNSYVSGQFMGSAQMNIAGTISTFTSSGGYDAFIAKVDTNGNIVWAKSVGAGTDDFTRTVHATADGVLLGGYISQTVAFDANDPQYTLNASEIGDPFLAKFDFNGNVVWSSIFQGDGDWVAVPNEITDVTTDASGNIIAVGRFHSTVDFDPGSGSHQVASYAQNFGDSFIVKLSAHYIWTRHFGNTSQDGQFTSIAIDQGGSIFVSGVFAGPTDFDGQLLTTSPDYFATPTFAVFRPMEICFGQKNGAER